MKLWMKIIISMILGTICGAVFGEKATVLKPLGSLFLGLINMLIVPLIFSSMVVGIASLNDPKTLGRVGIKALTFFLLTTMIAICVGLGLSKLGKPGKSFHLDRPTTITNEVQETGKDLTSLLMSLIPENPIQSMASGNILQVIIFSVFLGIAIIAAKDKGKPFLSIMESLADIMLKLTGIVMEFSPVGVFAIMAWVAGSFGVKVLLPLLQFLMLYYLGCLFQIFFVYFGILRFIGRLSPLPFLKGMGDAIMLAFSTTSSSASLPASLHCTQENLGVPRNIANFVLPLGSTVNMNGAAMFQGMTVIFLTQVYGIDITPTQLLTTIFAATLSAVGTAGIPGGSLVMLSVVLAPMNIPVEGIALLAGIDRLREMFSTVLNVLGDALCSVIVSRSEGTLKEETYYHLDIVKFDEQ